MICSKCNEHKNNYKMCEGESCKYNNREVNIICDDCYEIIKKNDKMILCYECIEGKYNYYNKKLHLEVNKLENLKNPTKLFNNIEKIKNRILEIENILKIIE